MLAFQVVFLSVGEGGGVSLLKSSWLQLGWIYKQVALKQANRPTGSTCEIFAKTTTECEKDVVFFLR